MPNFWTIENDSTSPPKGNALNGLQIQQVTSGTPPVVTGYDLMSGTTSKASTNNTTMPIEFLDVSFAGDTWNLTDIDVTPGVDGSGSWAIVGKAVPEDDGDNGEFQAQTGTVEDPDDAASSAYA